ncbi:MAG: hypothetical protein QME50_02720 [Candidatus Bathyarchaeota archaeon]|nr:hypothetical protein [Candidatus Bathyarchaeota archaeon]MDI6805401.1 hypothetical protein [Candidatus Bathyarchaeia archaeon]
MVEKRTLAFATLAVLVWAFLATSFMAYYYLQQSRFKDQFEEKQQLLRELTESYEESVAKRNSLSAEYGALLGEYQWFQGENYSSLMNAYSSLLSNLNGNYTSMLSEFPELNTTYNNLLAKTQTLSEKSEVTREEFGSLLNDFYKLFNALALKELDNAVGITSEIQVSLCINYTKIGGTVEWHNISISVCSTLFDLTRKVANITYDYYAIIEPGHIIITSINNQTAGWLWYYWDETINDWAWGPVGCDAWTLKNNGIYKWDVYS